MYRNLNYLSTKKINTSACLRQDKKAENWGRKKCEGLSTDNCLPETVGVAGSRFGVADFSLHCGVAGFNPRAFWDVTKADRKN